MYLLVFIPLVVLDGLFSHIPQDWIMYKRNHKQVWSMSSNYSLIIWASASTQCDISLSPSPSQGVQRIVKIHEDPICIHLLGESPEKPTDFE